jgi:excisionase family DNA binding protein
MKQPLGFTSEEATSALFVRVPVRQAEALDRLSFELKRPKRAIVSALLSALEAQPRRALVGHADLLSGEPPVTPEVLDLQQLAAYLGVDATVVQELAEHGELPGRRLGSEWRFSRSAVLDWLGNR